MNSSATLIRSDLKRSPLISRARPLNTAANRILFCKLDQIATIDCGPALARCCCRSKDCRSWFSHPRGCVIRLAMSNFVVPVGDFARPKQDVSDMPCKELLEEYAGDQPHRIDFVTASNHRQKVFNRGALRLCRGADVLKFDKNSTDSQCFLFHLGVVLKLRLGEQAPYLCDSTRSRHARLILRWVRNAQFRNHRRDLLSLVCIPWPTDIDSLLKWVARTGNICRRYAYCLVIVALVSASQLTAMTCRCMT